MLMEFCPIQNVSSKHQYRCLVKIININEIIIINMVVIIIIYTSLMNNSNSPGVPYQKHGPSWSNYRIYLSREGSRVNWPNRNPQICPRADAEGVIRDSCSPSLSCTRFSSLGLCVTMRLTPDNVLFPEDYIILFPSGCSYML